MENIDTVIIFRFTCSHFLTSSLCAVKELLGDFLGLNLKNMHSTASLCIPTSSWLAHHTLLYLITILCMLLCVLQNKSLKSLNLKKRKKEKK